MKNIYAAIFSVLMSTFFLITSYLLFEEVPSYIEGITLGFILYLFYKND